MEQLTATSGGTFGSDFLEELGQSRFGCACTDEPWLRVSYLTPEELYFFYLNK